jgi:plastocyanin
MMRAGDRIRKGDKLPVRWVSRIGFRGLALLMVFAMLGCYPATYREVSRSAPGDAGGTARVPRVQVYFYPKAGQTTEQQQRDHYECYNWAIQKTGFDPSQLQVAPEQRVRVVPMPPPGHDTVAMAIAGAVLGALFAGRRHAGAGALIGAAGGAIAGAASDASRQAYAEQVEEVHGSSNRMNDVQLEKKESEFRRAMSACLEGRGYSVQ